MGNLAKLLVKLNQNDEALKLVEDVYLGSTEKLGPDHFDTLRARRAFAKALYDQKRCEEAKEHYRTALDGFIRLVPPGHREIQTSMAALAGCLIALEELEQADALLSELLEQLMTSPGPSHRLTQRVITLAITANEQLENDDRVQQLKTLVRSSE